MSSKFQHVGSAYGIKGEFHRPIQEKIQVRPSLTLPAIGGYARESEDRFNLRDLVSFRRAYTEVSGSQQELIGGDTDQKAHNSLALSVIEHFNLLHVVEVRKIVNRITTRYFERAGSEEAEIVLTGSRFEGFRIFGREVIVELDTDLHLENPTFASFLKVCLPESRSNLNIVKKIIVPENTKDFSAEGNTITIPHVGRLYLGELTVEKESKTLTMMRWELGSPSSGDGSVGGNTGGGAGNP